MSNVYEKLQQARVSLQEKNLKKSGKNSYSGFSYYELADFIPQLNNIFLELKLCSNFSIKDNIAHLQIVNCEKPDEVITFTMPTAELTLKGCTAIQALGGVNTYCRRYLYLNALEIVESDMLDPNAGKIGQTKPQQKTQKEAQKVNNEEYIGLTEKTRLKEIMGAQDYAKEMITNQNKISIDRYHELLLEYDNE